MGSSRLGRSAIPGRAARTRPVGLAADRCASATMADADAAAAAAAAAPVGPAELAMLLLSMAVTCAAALAGLRSAMAPRSVTARPDGPMAHDTSVTDAAGRCTSFVYAAAARAARTAPSGSGTDGSAKLDGRTGTGLSGAGAVACSGIGARPTPPVACRAG